MSNLIVLQNVTFFWEAHTIGLAKNSGKFELSQSIFPYIRFYIYVKMLYVPVFNIGTCTITLEYFNFRPQRMKHKKFQFTLKIISRIVLRNFQFK